MESAKEVDEVLSVLKVESAKEVDEVLSVLRLECAGKGMTCHPFLLSWYHAKVQPPFFFPYDGDTLAVLLLSLPSMFEELFLPFLASHVHFTRDPLDECLKQFFSHLRAQFPSNDVEVIHDFELDPVSRRPRILVQTAGHVAGAACYYQRSDVVPAPWPEKEKIFGVSIHPEFGGWFAFRGALIFRDILAPSLKQVEPKDCVPTQRLRIELLEKFNKNWKDWTYRDVLLGTVKERYSSKQRRYFETEPGKRGALLKWLCSSGDSVSVSSLATAET